MEICWTLDVSVIIGQTYSTEKQGKCNRIGISKRDKIVDYVACIKTVITLKATHFYQKYAFL